MIVVGLVVSDRRPGKRRPGGVALLMLTLLLLWGVLALVFAPSWRVMFGLQP